MSRLLAALAFALPVLMPVSSLGQQPSALETRVFTIQHKELDDVVSLIRPSLSEESSILMQSKLNSLTVIDYPGNLDAVTDLIDSFDLPPHNVNLNINLIQASRGGPGPRAKMTPRLPPSLREVTKWLDYDLLGGASLLAAESERSSLMLGGEYRIRFQVDLVDDRAGKVRLKGFSLERRTLRPAEGEIYVPIFDTVVNLKSGTPYVFGATRGQNATRALFLTITADIEP